MDKKKRRLGYTGIGLITGIALLGRGLIRYNHYQQKQEAQQEVVSQSKVVSEAMSEENSQREEEKQELFGKMFKLANAEKFEKKYETFKTAEDDSYGLGRLNGQYYLVDLSSEKESLLENTDIAYVLPITETSDNSQLTAIFAHQNGEWHLLDKQGNSLLSFGDAPITETSSFTVTNNVIDLAQ